MSDLISREAVINLLRELRVDDVAVNGKRITELINELPTAYDVEKVVEGLEEVKKAVSGCSGIMCSECKYTSKCYTGEMTYKVSIDKSIDIVKRGGVE